MKCKIEDDPYRKWRKFTNVVEQWRLKLARRIEPKMLAEFYALSGFASFQSNAPNYVWLPHDV